MNMPNPAVDFEQELQVLISACKSAREAEKLLAEALDRLVPMAIDGLIAHKNCNQLARITRAIKENWPSKLGKFVKDFIAYCEEYIGAPKNAIVWASASEKLLCNTSAISAWRQEPIANWQEKKTLSQWLKERKAAPKSEDEIRLAFRKKAEAFKKAIESAGYQFEMSELVAELEKILK